MEGIKNFHKRLIELIKKRGMSVKYVSKQVGMPNTTLFSWTTGVIPKDPETLRKLAIFLEADFYFLLFGQHDPKSKLKEMKQSDRYEFEVTVIRKNS